VFGADNAAKYGAVGALVRSVASFSIYSVHAGGQYSKAIPIAAITVEDAEMLQRMQNRGQRITLHLVL
jgi:carboxypeptidase Q